MADLFAFDNEHFDEYERSADEWPGPLRGHLCEYVATCALEPPERQPREDRDP